MLSKTLIPYFMEFLRLKELISFSSLKKMYMFYLKTYFKNLDWNEGLTIASKRNNKEMIGLCIINGVNNWNYGLYHACCGGHKDLVDFFINKGATDLYWGIIYATEGGHEELVIKLNRYHSI